MPEKNLSDKVVALIQDLLLDNLKDDEYKKSKFAKLEKIHANGGKYKDEEITDSLLTVLKYCLGICYKEGIVTDKNFEKAFEFLSVAYEKELLKLLEEFGVEKFPYTNEERKLFESSKNIGAAEYRRDLMESRISEVEHFLGFCHLEGIGTEKDLKKAYAYFLKSAKEQLPESYYSLGMFYAKNLGNVLTKPSLMRAINCFELCLENLQQRSVLQNSVFSEPSYVEVSSLYIDSESSIDLLSPIYPCSLNDSLEYDETVALSNPLVPPLSPHSSPIGHNQIDSPVNPLLPPSGWRSAVKQHEVKNPSRDDLKALAEEAKKIVIDSIQETNLVASFYNKAIAAILSQDKKKYVGRSFFR